MEQKPMKEKEKSNIQTKETESSVFITLQNILLPESETGFPETLYFRREPWDEKAAFVGSEPARLVFCKGKMISFDTYLNCLSIGKWKKYTAVSGVSLILSCSGSFEVSLTWIRDLQYTIKKQVLKREVIRSENVTEYRFAYSVLPEDGILAFELKALEENAVFYSGYYEGALSEAPRDQINIAVNICTYKRETFIIKNLARLRESILENPESPLYGHMQVFVSDNGQTLDLDELNTETIHIVYNKNTGGSGGFTRGLIEIMEAQEQFKISNVIFMDDDVVFLPEAFFRTYAMLCCLKPEFEDDTIGGTMLCLSNPAIQNENGACCPEGFFNPNKNELNLNSLKNVLGNEEEELIQYNAWFFCCNSMKDITPGNLPLPFFIKFDDVEYCFRNKRRIITLNGICIWHIEFIKKISPLNDYYETRNRLFMAALHIPNVSLKKMNKRVYNLVIRLIMNYQYETAELFTKAMKDWLGGMRFLRETDSEALNSEISDKKNKMILFEMLDLPKDCRIHFVKEGDRREKKLNRLLRRLFLNGLFLPVNQKPDEIRAVPINEWNPIDFYRQQRVICFDPESGKAYIAERNTRRAIKSYLSFLKVYYEVWVTQKVKQAQFQQDFRELTNIEFWKRYLGI